MQVFKVDDGLVVRLPERLVETMDLKPGDELAIIESSKQKIVVEKVDRRARFLKDMEQFRWPASEGYKFDRDEANERRSVFLTQTSSFMPFSMSTSVRQRLVSFLRADASAHKC